MQSTTDNSCVLDIAVHFDTDGKPVSASALGNGLINDTFLITTDKGARYVLQRINTSIFRDPALLQRNLKKITDHIRRCLTDDGASDIDRRTLTPVDTSAGDDFYLTPEGEAWRATRFIEGSKSVETVTPEMARITGKAFAAFHSYFAREGAPQLEETIPDFHNLRFRIDTLRKSVAADKAGRNAATAEITRELLDRADEMLLAERLAAAGELPRRVAHCDTKVNNILFDENGDILCVIDLDTTMPGFILSDFGDFIRTAANTGAEDARDLSTVGVDMDIFRNFASGYVGEASFLTPAEKRLLPFGAKMLTYMQTVRFLTDYLDGDCYYKTLYPGHNLVRTRAQLKLLHEIDRNFDDMNAFIASL